MKRCWLSLALLLIAALAQAGSAPGAQRVTVTGKPDGAVPGWTLSTVAPDGWTADCCTYAAAIGVNFVLYQGEWTGKPQRVMVLNVWPAKLPTLAAEWQADRKRYLQRDPRAKADTFALAHPPVACHGLHYQGTDHVDDLVVFCDPGKAGGIRYSWSMTLAADDPQTAQLTALFRQVVERSRYRMTPAVAPAR